MKFVLTFDGKLPPSANKPKPDDVWAIRKQFHPQLLDLWANHPALRSVQRSGNYPRAGGLLINGHHTYDGPLATSFARPVSENPQVDTSVLDLNEEIEKHGHKFRPLVRESYALQAGLKIIFLRKEPPGRVYQGGDIDGRIKTLLDALAMPQHLEQVRLDSTAPNPVFCLLEDDSMITDLDVETERLLTDQDHPKDYARLVIQVSVRVRMATVYNQSFVG